MSSIDRGFNLIDRWCCREPEPGWHHRRDRNDALGRFWFDLAPDDTRLAVEVVESTSEPLRPQHEVTFLINFFNELVRRAPVGK